MQLPLPLRLKLFTEDYAARLDRGELEAWPGYFSDDALYLVTSRENHAAGLEHATLYCRGRAMLLDRVAAIRTATVFEPRRMRHIIGGVHLTEGHGAMAAETSFALYESIADQEPRLYMVGSYIDELEPVGDGFRLRARRCVYDNARIYNSLIYPV